VKAFFYIAVMLPMWASYIVKAYAWTLLLAKDGVAQWFLSHLGLEPILTSADAPGGWRQYLVDLRAGALSGVRLHLAAVYDPAGAGGAGTPAASLLQASADLGARPRQTFRYVVLPLAIPGIAAGSIFTFSLTLGIYRAAAGGAAGLLYRQYGLFPAGAIGNMPMAAAFTLVPIVLIPFIWRS
jgi:putative spermidine/putrescine transport system permease protein